MKKIIYFTFALTLAAHAFAATTVTNNFTAGSGLVKDDLTVTTSITKNFTAGVGGTLINTDAFKDYVYSVNVPLSFNAGFTQIVFRPFYVFEQDELDSKGAMLHFLMNVNKDDVNSVYSQAFLSAAYVNEKAYVERDNSSKIEDFDQMAFSAGLRMNYYNTFFFTLGATAHVYNSGISNVQYIRSITDKNMLANLDTYGAVFGAPKYSVGMKMARGFENKTNIYLSYRFIEMYLAPSVHSMTIGNEFAIFRNLWADAGYNHTIDTDNKKEDFFRLALNFKF